MDISVRSPHGDADVSIVADPTATIADVVVVVTGQAVPQVVEVDGRAIPSSTRLLDSGVRIGSVIAVGAARAESAADGPVRLVQLAGPGTGRTVPLEPGRYRLGPARRLSDHELRIAPVESVAIELDVAADGVVRVIATDDDVRIGAIVPTTPTVLGQLAVASTTRAFTVESIGAEDHPGAADAPGSDGTVLVNRSAHGTTAARRRPVVDALGLAAHRTTSLWPIRSQDDVTGVPVGVSVDPDGTWRAVTTPPLAAPGTASADGIGIVGSELLRSGVARSILAELSVEHSPAELSISIVTTNPAAWEWAKWLPHLRRSVRPAILPPHRCAAVFATGDADARSPGIVVVDDPSLWSRPDAPLRGRWGDLAANTTVLAMCSTRSEVPSICRTIIDEHRTGRVSVFGARRTTIDDVIPAVADAETVERLARLLAPLVDADDTRERDPTPTTDWPRFCGVGADIGVDELRTRWSHPPDDSTPRTVLVRAASLSTAVDVGGAVAIDIALRRPPDALRILPIIDGDTLVTRLPHSDPTLGFTAIGADDDSPSLGGVGVDRLERRLRALLDGPAGPSHVVVLVAVGDDADPAAVARAIATVELASADITVIVATDAAEPFTATDRTISVTESTSHLTLSIADGGDPDVDDPDGDDPDGGHIASPAVIALAEVTGVDVRPFVHGRHPTPAERRLDHGRTRRTHPDLVRLVGVAGNAADPRSAAPRLTPRPVPVRAGIGLMLDWHPGDAVPLATVDRPELDDDEVFWWRPGDGSLLAIGDRSTAVADVIEVLLLGIGARFGDDDLHLVTLSRSPRVRALAADRTQSRLVLEPGGLTDESVAEISALVADPSRPTVVLVDDVTTVRRALAPEDFDRFVDAVAAASLVATSSAVGDAPVGHRFGRHLIGAIGPDDAARLGARTPPIDPTHCLVVETGATIVLATPDADVSAGPTDGGFR